MSGPWRAERVDGEWCAVTEFGEPRLDAMGKPYVNPVRRRRPLGCATAEEARALVARMNDIERTRPR